MRAGHPWRNAYQDAWDQPHSLPAARQRPHQAGTAIPEHRAARAPCAWRPVHIAGIARVRPERAAFFGCLYYAALRPEEAIALRRDALILPAHGRGKIVLTTACPRTGTAWTGTGTSFELRGLKHRPDGAIRAVPIPPEMVDMLRRHLREFGTAPDGRLFRGARGGMLTESVYGRAWHSAHQAALGPDLAASPLARRPYDLRHAALSLWLTASGAPAEVAARAGNSARVLHDVYLHCTDGQNDIVSQRIEDALTAAEAATASPSQGVTASGSTHRRFRPRPCPLSVRERAPVPAHGPRPRRRTGSHRLTQIPAPNVVSAGQNASASLQSTTGGRPDLAHA